MHRNSFIISSFLAVFSFFFLAASSSAAKITESVSINTLNTTTDAASLSEQTVFSTHPPTVNAKKPHIGAITPNLPESVTGHVLYLIHHDRVIDRICHYDASGFTVTPKRGTFNRKTVLEGFQDHHIISDKNILTKNHELLDLSGVNLHSRGNKIFLPTDASLHPTRSIHLGRHTTKVSRNLAEQMDAIVRVGKQQGWSQAQYQQALKSIISQERQLLKSGQRALNKNRRAGSQ